MCSRGENSFFRARETGGGELKGFITGFLLFFDVLGDALASGIYVLIGL